MYKTTGFLSFVLRRFTGVVLVLVSAAAYLGDQFCNQWCRHV